ncbi:MAG: hypothetical protein OJF62_002221 [Pseudolabrys sp.]|jgi:hypothetical protein|nr:hypothetical protein [Pseudolabrys sp.]
MLLELQRQMLAGLIGETPGAIGAALADGVNPDRIGIYRNTVLHGLTRSLRLVFPTVELLVGADFFAAMAAAYATSCLPRAARLDCYGDGVADFLDAFEPAATVPYLGDVARLDWAVNNALHAPDVAPLDPARLTQAADWQDRIRLRPHPALTLLTSRYPVDDIWRAVLARDDAAMAGIDLAAGPVFLLIERQGEEVAVSRMDIAAWQFLSVLCSGQPLLAVLGRADGPDAAVMLADHFAAGRFADFSVARCERQNDRECD